MYVIAVTDRNSGAVRAFDGPTQADAWKKATDYIQSQVPITACNLLNVLAPSRAMLEECDESGATAAAFTALEEALRDHSAR